MFSGAAQLASLSAKPQSANHHFFFPQSSGFDKAKLFKIPNAVLPPLTVIQRYHKCVLLDSTVMPQTSAKFTEVSFQWLAITQYNGYPPK